MYESVAGAFGMPAPTLADLLDRFFRAQETLRRVLAVVLPETSSRPPSPPRGRRISSHGKACISTAGRSRGQTPATKNFAEQEDDP
jgi:hypothetical protein